MNDRTTVLVTGASGFVGRHLARYLAARDYNIIAASRAAMDLTVSNVVPTPLPDLFTEFDWQPLIQRCDAIVHLAGIAHRHASEEQYDRVNRLAIRALSAAAFQHRKHLVFISSIAAQCGSFSDYELSENDLPIPTNTYGKSKLAGEQVVRESGGPFTILRPVVIYGDGEKGNFALIRKVSRLPLPLPFRRLTAKRSILSIENFSSAVATVLASTRAIGETYIVSDPTPVTIPEVIAHYRLSAGRSPWLVPIPKKWLEFSLRAFGQGAIWDVIGRPLVARPRKLLALGWTPPRETLSDL
jgi:UDP-glucose 4-epimerase